MATRLNHERVAGSNEFRFLDFESTSRQPTLRLNLRQSSDSYLAPEGGATGVTSGAAELLLDADELVVLGEAVGARQRAGLDLSAIGADRQIGDGCVLGFARAVRHDLGVIGATRQRHGFERLAKRTNLVDLDQDGVADVLLDAVGQALWVGDEEIVADQLDLLAK